MVNYYRLIIDFYILYNAQELIFVSFFFFFGFMIIISHIIIN